MFERKCTLHRSGFYWIDRTTEFINNKHECEKIQKDGYSTYLILMYKKICYSLKAQLICVQKKIKLLHCTKYIL